MKSVSCTLGYVASSKLCPCDLGLLRVGCAPGRLLDGNVTNLRLELWKIRSTYTLVLLCFSLVRALIVVVALEIRAG